MVYFCTKCRTTHNEDELCPHIKKELKDDPRLLSDAANFVNIAGQYHLVTSQGLDVVAQKVNNVIGTNLRFEGTHQFARDIQVFNRLNVETYPRLGIFNSPEAAKAYLENATPDQLKDLGAKIVGQGQEVDWLRSKQGEIRSIVEKSKLLTGNAPGVDGEVVNRFTGRKITRVTVKAASTQGGIKTGTDSIIEALKKGTLKPNETAFMTKGMKDRLLNDLQRNIDHAKSIGDINTVDILTKAKQGLKVVEHGTVTDAAVAKGRVLNKIADGKANTVITAKDALNKAAQGAVIGAALGLTISSITNYMRYRKGELTRLEAFVNIGEDTAKSAITGGAMGAITLFLPAGAVGFVAGFAIGMYLNAALTNVLDEVFGKGAYLEIMTASGYIMGTSMNLSSALRAFAADRKAASESFKRIEGAQKHIDMELEKINEKLGVL